MQVNIETFCIGTFYSELMEMQVSNKICSNFHFVPPVKNFAKYIWCCDSTWLQMKLCVSWSRHFCCEDYHQHNRDFELEKVIQCVGVVAVDALVRAVVDVVILSVVSEEMLTQLLKRRNWLLKFFARTWEKLNNSCRKQDFKITFSEFFCERKV